MYTSTTTSFQYCRLAVLDLKRADNSGVAAYSRFDLEAMKKTTLVSVLTLAVLVCMIVWVAERTSRTQQNANGESAFPAIGESSARFDSPYDIEQYINQHNDDADLSEIWSRFGIPTEPGKPGRCGCRGYDCPGNCNAEIIDVSVSNGKSDYVILRVCYGGEADCWYLGFKKEREWKYVGIAVSSNNQYQPPQHRIVKHKSERWLVIRELWRRGTGFLQYGERWCELSDNGPREVLSYPVSGHSAQGDPEDYEFKSEVWNLDEQPTFQIDIHYTVLSDGSDANEIQGLKSHQLDLLFEWDVAAKRFVLNESKSKPPKSENDPIFKYLVQHRFVK
jgi:hypothetical protein